MLQPAADLVSAGASLEAFLADQDRTGAAGTGDDGLFAGHLRKRFDSARVPLCAFRQPSLRGAKRRSNPESCAGPWIASSQLLLAMTGEAAKSFPIHRKTVKPSNKKYSAFQNTQISGICSPVPAPIEGRIARSSRHVGRGMRWTRRRQVLQAGRRHGCGRRSRVVLAPRPWRLSGPACAGLATVTKNAAHRGEHV